MIVTSVTKPASVENKANSPADIMPARAQGSILMGRWCFNSRTLTCEPMIKLAAFIPNSKPYVWGLTPKCSINRRGEPTI